MLCTTLSGKAENQNPPVQQQGTAASILASVAAVVAPPPQANNTANQEQAAVAPPAKKKQKKQQQQLNPTNEANNSTPNFRNLQLPIASFSLPTDTSAIASTPKSSPSANTPTKQQPAPTPPSTLPLPTATPSHLKWKNDVIATRQHSNYTNAFNYQRIQQLELSHGLSTT